MSPGRAGITIDPPPTGSRWLTIRSPCILSLALLLAAPAHAGWPPGGSLVFPGSAFVQLHQLVEDGAGGAYVLVESEPAATFSIRLSHFTGDGSTSPGWPMGGLVLATQRPRPSGRLSPDGAGNVFASTLGGPFVDRTLRIGPTGETVGAWPDEGVTNFFPFVVPDAVGGDVVYSSNGDEILAQRFLDDGAPDPAWPSGGRVVMTTPNSQLMALPTTGGAFLVWTSGAELFTLRVGDDAIAAPGWPAAGVVLSGATTVGFVAATTDSAGLSAAWEAMAPLGEDLYGQSIDPDGALRWGDEPRALCTIDGAQRVPSIVADSSGGVLVAWDDYRLAHDLYALRLTPEGEVAPGWTPDGSFVAHEVPFDAAIPNPLVADGAGGVFMAWTDNVLIRAQHLTGSGAVADGWSADGLALNTPGPSPPGSPLMVRAGGGDAIVAWLSSDGVLAARIRADGIVPVVVALASAEATPDRVRLTWFGVETEGVLFRVLRRDANSPWRAVAEAVADGEERIVYEDRDVIPGARYGYALRAGDEQALLGEHWVDVPAREAAALPGFSPNPARGRPRVAFTLAGLAPATLEILDIAGRRVASRQVDGLGPGRHAIEVADTPLAPGLYLIRLRQGAETRTARGVVVE